MAALLQRIVAILLTRVAGGPTPSKNLIALWRDAARHRGLREATHTRFPSTRLIAEGSAWRATFEPQMDGKEDTGTRITVARVSGAAFPMSLRAESSWAAWEKLRGAQEVEVGDPSFDDVFYIRGEESSVLAALSSKARGQAQTLLAGASLEIGPDGISAQISAANEDSIDPVLGQLLDLAAELSAGSSVPARLATNAVADRVPGVRLRNLVVLAREFPREEVALGAFRAAASDVVPELRLRAALALGAEGVAVLEQLAFDAEIPDECSAEALAQLGDRLPTDRQIATLRAALRARRIETAAVCIERLADREAPEAAAVLAKVLAVEGGRLGLAAAKALGGQRSERAESALREAIEREEEPDIRLSAAESLGRVGTIASVPSLQECARRHSGERLLQTAVRQSVAEIQSRRLGAEHGQLSLAAPTSGALSLATETGRLSLVETGTEPAAPGPHPSGGRRQG